MDTIEDCTFEQYRMILTERFTILHRLADVERKEDMAAKMEEYFGMLTAKPADDMIPYNDFIRSIVTDKNIGQCWKFMETNDYMSALESLDIFSSFELYYLSNIEDPFMMRGDGPEHKANHFLRLFGYLVKLDRSLKTIDDETMPSTKENLIERFVRYDYIYRYALLHSCNNTFDHENSIEIIPDYYSLFPKNLFWSMVSWIQEGEEDYFDKIEGSGLFNDRFLANFKKMKNVQEGNIIGHAGLTMERYKNIEDYKRGYFISEKYYL